MMGSTTRSQALPRPSRCTRTADRPRLVARGIDKQPTEILLHIAECIEDAASLASFSAACRTIRYASLPSLYVRFFRTRGGLGRGLWRTSDLPKVGIETKWPHLQEPPRDRHPALTSGGADWDSVEMSAIELLMRDQETRGPRMKISLVHAAAACGLDELLRCLVTEEADLSDRATVGSFRSDVFRWVYDTSPLALAISNQRLSTAELLLELGAEAQDGWNAALRVGRADFVELLIRYNPELRTQGLHRRHRYYEEENAGRPLSPLSFCLEVGTRDPVAIFRDCARHGFDTGESLYGVDRLLPRAVVLGHKETAHLLAEELSTAHDIAPLFRLVAQFAHEPAGRSAEGVLRAMARAGRVQGGALPRDCRRNMPEVFWEAPMQALRDWAHMDRLYRLFGIAEPVISQALLPEKAVAGRPPPANTYAYAPSDTDNLDHEMIREILMRVQEDLDYVRSSARNTDGSYQCPNVSLAFTPSIAPFPFSLAKYHTKSALM